MFASKPIVEKLADSTHTEKRPDSENSQKGCPQRIRCPAKRSLQAGHFIHIRKKPHDCKRWQDPSPRAKIDFTHSVSSSHAEEDLSRRGQGLRSKDHPSDQDCDESQPDT